MTIRRSLATEIADLVAHLASLHPVERESALARLAIIGMRAAGALETTVADPQAPELARAGALAALAAMRAPRTADLAGSLLLQRPQGPVALESLEIVRWASLGTGKGAAAAFEQITELALDRSAPASLRVSAVDALRSHPPALIAPVLDALTHDPSPDVARAAGIATAPPAPSIDAALRLSPEAAGEAIRQSAADLSPSALIRALDLAGANERRDPDRGEGWQLVLAQLHQVLAARNSRLGLYDLRERFERATAPLPLGFVLAAAEVGDRSCLDALARAWQAVDRPEDGWWRTHVARAFTAIAAREGIGRHAAVMKKIAARRPGAQVLIDGVPLPVRSRPAGSRLSKPSRTRP